MYGPSRYDEQPRPCASISAAPERSRTPSAAWPARAPGTSKSPSASRGTCSSPDSPATGRTRAGSRASSEAATPATRRSCWSTTASAVAPLARSRRPGRPSLPERCKKHDVGAPLLDARHATRDGLTRTVWLSRSCRNYASCRSTSRRRGGRRAMASSSRSTRTRPSSRCSERRLATTGG